tara:strand:- start:423 stop:842 length:420 start_codon:yes stop_codon:yes gene_type:complete
MNIKNELHRAAVFDNERVNSDIMRFLLDQWLLVKDIDECWTSENKVPGNGSAHIDLTQLLTHSFPRYKKLRNVTLNNIKNVLYKARYCVDFEDLNSVDGHDCLNVPSFKFSITNLDGYLMLIHEQRRLVFDIRRLRGRV